MIDLEITDLSFFTVENLAACAADNAAEHGIEPAYEDVFQTALWAVMICIENGLHVYSREGTPTGAFVRACHRLWEMKSEGDF